MCIKFSNLSWDKEVYETRLGMPAPACDGWDGTSLLLACYCLWGMWDAAVKWPDFKLNLSSIVGQEQQVAERGLVLTEDMDQCSAEMEPEQGVLYPDPASILLTWNWDKSNINPWNLDRLGGGKAPYWLTQTPK